MARIDLDLLDRIGDQVYRGERDWPTEWTRVRAPFDVTRWNTGDLPEDEPFESNGGDKTDAPRRTIAMAGDGQKEFIRSLLTQVPARIAEAHATLDLDKLTKKAASKLIDELKLDAIRRPTEGQWNFLNSLVADRDPNGELAKLVQALVDNSDTSFDTVSKTIDAVKLMPVVSTPTGTTGNADDALWNELAAPLADMGGQHGARFAVDTEEGASNTLAFWVVRRGRNGKIYLNQYLGGQGPVRVRMSRPAQLSVIRKIIDAGAYAAMQRFGQELGNCGRCGHDLTDDTSRARGIGPDCWNKG